MESTLAYPGESNSALWRPRPILLETLNQASGERELPAALSTLGNVVADGDEKNAPLGIKRIALREMSFVAAWDISNAARAAYSYIF